MKRVRGLAQSPAAGHEIIHEDDSLRRACEGCGEFCTEANSTLETALEGEGGLPFFRVSVGVGFWQEGESSVEGNARFVADPFCDLLGAASSHFPSAVVGLGDRDNRFGLDFAPGADELRVGMKDLAIEKRTSVDLPFFENGVAGIEEQVAG